MSNLFTLFGPPGAGKSTLGDLLHRDAGFAHLALGKMLRDGELVRAAGLDAEIVQRALATGQLITDPALISWLDATIEASDQPIVVDGYPRALSAVSPFNALVNRLYPKRKLVAIELVCSEAELQRRLRLRRREDDSAEVAHQRMEHYRLDQKPVLDRLDHRVARIQLNSELEPKLWLSRIATLLPQDFRFASNLASHSTGEGS